MISFIKRLNKKKFTALARIGQDYSPSRRQIVEKQNLWGMLTNLAKIYSFHSKF